MSNKSKILFLKFSLISSTFITSADIKVYAQDSQPDFNMVIAKIAEAYQNREFVNVITFGSFYAQDPYTPPSLKVKFYEFMSRAELEVGNKVQAKSHMKKLFDITPRYRPDRKKLPPKFVEFVDSVRAEFWPKQFFYGGLSSSLYELGYDKIIKQSPWSIGLNFTRLQQKLKDSSQSHEIARYTLLSFEMKYIHLLSSSFIVRFNTVYGIIGQGLSLSPESGSSDKLSWSTNQKSYALTLGFGADVDKLLWDLDVFMEIRWLYIADHRSEFYNRVILGIKL